MKRFKISIIVPVYNVERYLRTCIDSILCQKGNEPFEVILVNDGSRDNGGAICDEYAAAFADVKVIHKRNGGLSSARNAGLAVAEGDYILFVDSDDFIDEHLLESCLNKIQESKEPDMIQFAFAYTSEDGRVQEKVKGPWCTDLYTDIEKYGIHRHFRPFAWCYLIKRELIEKHALCFQEDLLFAEDVHFTLRCLFFAQTIQTLKTPLYYYRQRRGSLMAQNSTYATAWYHIHIAELLIESFYKEKDSNFSFFFKKRIHQLVVVYLKQLSKLEYNNDIIRRAQSDLAHFNAICKQNPNCITNGITLTCANIYLPAYLIWRKVAHASLRPNVQTKRNPSPVFEPLMSVG